MADVITDQEKINTIFRVFSHEQLYKLAITLAKIKTSGHGKITLRIKEHELRFMDVETSSDFKAETYSLEREEQK